MAKAVAMQGTGSFPASSVQHIFSLLPESAGLGEWRATSDYQVWTQCVPLTGPQLVLWETRGRGVVRIPDLDTILHAIPAGVAHHVEGLFGYWRVSQSDILWMRARRDPWVHHAMILGGDRANASQIDVICWICPQCATHFGHREIEFRRKSPGTFAASEEAAIASFNTAEAARTCPSCGKLHPPAYRFGNELQHGQIAERW